MKMKKKVHYISDGVYFDKILIRDLYNNDDNVMLKIWRAVIKW